MKFFIYRIINKIFNFYNNEKLNILKKSIHSCGTNVNIDKDATLWGVTGISICNDVTINANTFIFGSGGVQIGNRVQISANCVITSVTHPKEIEMRNEIIFKSVSIDDDVWIGAGALILPGVKIGRGSIVGAGAVVTKNVPDCSIVFGNPAKIKAIINEY